VSAAKVLPEKSSNVTPGDAENMLRRFGFTSRRTKHGLLWKHPSGARTQTPGRGHGRRLGYENIRKINQALIESQAHAMPPNADIVITDPDTGEVKTVITKPLPGLGEPQVYTVRDIEPPRKFACGPQLSEEPEEEDQVGRKRRGTKTQTQPPAQPAAPEKPENPLETMLVDARSTYELALELMTDPKLEGQIDEGARVVEKLVHQLRTAEEGLEVLRAKRAASRDECRGSASQAIKDIRAACQLLRIDFPDDLMPLPTSRDVGVLGERWRAALPGRVQSRTVDRMRLVEELAASGEPFKLSDLEALGMPDQSAQRLMGLADDAGLIKISGRTADGRGRKTVLTWVGT